MKTFTDFGQLQTEIMKKAKIAMSNGLAPKIEKMLVDKASKIPKTNYSRLSDGISDIDNITHEIEYDTQSATLIVKDIALPGESVFGTFGADVIEETTFSRWINDGEWMDIAGYLESGGTKKPKRKPIPFIDEVQETINEKPSIVIDVLKKYL